MDKRTALIIGEPSTLTRDESDCLTRAGIAITTVPDFVRAFKVSEAESFGVAIMDLSVNPLDGLTILDGLKRIDSSIPLEAVRDFRNFIEAAGDCRH